MEENNSKKVLLSVLGVAILVVAVVGVSFAAFSFANTPSTNNSITTGTITMSFSEETAGISITNADPVADETAKVDKTANHYFDFTVSRKTDAALKVPYEISISEGSMGEGETKLPTKYVTVYLTKVNGETETAVVGPTKLSTLIVESNRSNLNKTTAYKLYEVNDTATTHTGTAENYRLRMWVNTDAQFTPDGTGSILNSKTKYAYKLTVNVNSQVNALGNQ